MGRGRGRTRNKSVKKKKESGWIITINNNITITNKQQTFSYQFAVLFP
jgi:hypothetical protein